MLVHPDFNPVALSLGPLSIQWYGLMYVVGFLAGAWLGVRRTRAPGSTWKPDDVWDLVFYVFVGVILGGRIGYSLFYNFAHYASHPLDIFKIWEGGMSFHGGLLGVIIAVAVFAMVKNRRYLEVTDFLAPLCAIGLGAGRIGNFINQELWGRVTTSPLGMVFPAEGPGAQPRHPSQLYEAVLEGLVLFVIIWIFSAKPRAAGAVSGLFLVCYGAFRFIVEFFREPDAHLSFVAFDWVTMGQVLSVPVIVLGLVVLMISRTLGVSRSA